MNLVLISEVAKRNKIKDVKKFKQFALSLFGMHGMIRTWIQPSKNQVNGYNLRTKEYVVNKNTKPKFLAMRQEDAKILLRENEVDVEMFTSGAIRTSVDKCVMCDYLDPDVIWRSQPFTQGYRNLFILESQVEKLVNAFVYNQKGVVNE